MSASIRAEVLMRANKQPSSRQSRRVGRPGQGIIEANRKTEICRHWLTGACPFGVKCAFAHGAQELRSPANDMEHTIRVGTPAEGNQFMRTAAVDTPTSCPDPRCITSHNRSLCGGDSSWLARGSHDHSHRSSSRNDGNLDGFWVVNESHPSIIDKRASQTPLNCIAPGSQRLNRNSDQTDNRTPFSMWQSPKATLEDTNIDRSAPAGNNNAVTTPLRGAFNKADSRTPVNRYATPPSTYADSTLRETTNEYGSWARVARGDVSGDGGNDGSCGPSDANRVSRGAARCAAVVGYDSTTEVAPQADRFSLFQTPRSTARSTSILFEPSPSNQPISASLSTPLTADATVGWDPASSNPYGAITLFENSPTSFREVLKTKAPPQAAPRGSPFAQQRFDEDDRAVPSMVPSFLEPSKLCNTASQGTIPPWYSVVPPLFAKEESESKKRETSAVGFSRLSCSFSDASTQPPSGSNSPGELSCSTRPAISSLDDGWQPIQNAHNSPDLYSQTERFQGIPTNGPTSTAPPSKFVWGLGASDKSHVGVSGSSSLW